MDFEQAVIQAAKTVIGEHLVKYNHDNDFSHYCIHGRYYSMVDDLAFLLVQKVQST